MFREIRRKKQLLSQEETIKIMEQGTLNCPQKVRHI